LDGDRAPRKKPPPGAAGEREFHNADDEVDASQEEEDGEETSEEGSEPGNFSEGHRFEEDEHLSAAHHEGEIPLDEARKDRKFQMSTPIDTRHFTQPLLPLELQKRVHKAEGWLQSAMAFLDAQAKNVQPTDLDHDHLALTGPKPGASDKRDGQLKKKRDEPAKVPPTPQDSGSTDRERQREREWKSICEHDRAEYSDGDRPKRVFYHGNICGYPPGTRKGLIQGWSYKTNQPVYVITAETAVRLMFDLLRQREQEARRRIRKGGVEEAKKVRRAYADLLNGLVEEQHSGQINDIWQATQFVLTKWEDEEIPHKKVGIPSLAALVTDTEEELEERIGRRDLNALLKAKADKKRVPRKGQSLPRAPPSAPVVGTVTPDPPNLGATHPLPKITKTEPEDDEVSPRTELRQEIAKHTAALEEETRLRAQLDKVVAEREALRRGRPRSASPRDLRGAIEPIRHRSVSRMGRPAIEEEGDNRTSSGLAGSRTASSLDRSSLHPLMRKFYQSPFVSAVEEYRATEQATRARREWRRERAADRKRRRRRGEIVSSSSEDEEAMLGIPTTVKFRDRIKTFPKFSKPDGNMTWLDFVSQLVDILQIYQVPSNEWAAWLVDRLTGKAQSALMNLPTRDRGDWAILMSSLNSYFHVEFEMRAAEEELLVRKQGNKESVRDFITQLMYLARKAYGQDIEKREAAVLKRLELGLFSASLRRTFDELMLEPGMTLSILQAALVQRETRDDPGKYQTYITQEREAENAKKPQHSSAANIAKEVVKEVTSKVHGSETVESASALFTAPQNRPFDNRLGSGRGRGSARGRGRGSTTRGGGSAGPGRGTDLSEVVCWKCENTGHYRTSCPQASQEELQLWNEAFRKKRDEKYGASQPKTDPRSSGKSAGN